MKANELQINNFLQAPNVQFVIPVYQRNYDWTNTECKDLLNDIISVETEDRGTHFIGSIVFVHEGTYSTSEVKELVIIDGQQRPIPWFVSSRNTFLFYCFVKTLTKAKMAFKNQLKALFLFQKLGRFVFVL